MYTYSTSGRTISDCIITDTHLYLLVIVRLLLFRGDLRTMENYLVRAQFGHVGRNNYIIKTIPVFAENGKEAAFKVRWMGRVKHDRKDAIIDVRKATFEEYLEQKETNRNDPYFSVHSKQEQMVLCTNISDQIISYDTENKNEKKKNRLNRIKYKMKKHRIMKKDAIQSMRNYDA